jgi:glycosyltransferase involved in cell wall biosynthesis
MKPFFSIAIPTYEMKGYGEEFLEVSFIKLARQTFKNFEVIVSDHSRDDVIKGLCDRWKENLDIKYFRNDYKIGGSSPNINNAIKHSNGEWIKLLWQDDFLFSENSLDIIKKHIDKTEGIVWLASACEHTNDGVVMYNPFYPTWTADIHLGNNRVSSPSVITIKNTDDKLYFDEDLIWLMDVEYYKRMYIKHGEPSYLNLITVVNRTWADSVSNTLSQEIKNNEVKLMFERYNK